jgi:peptide-methionine (S)-S-oxide reductase
VRRASARQWIADGTQRAGVPSHPSHAGGPKGLHTDRINAMPPSSTLETAVLGGGCFWCLDAVFRELAGVESIESGYAGGRTAHPTYEEVCSGDTGHAEVVRLAFDPSVVSFRDLLRVFFTIHDPTTRDRQGNDVGTQYRSVIFCQTPEQRADAQAVIAELNTEKVWPAPIVTEVADAATFHPAETYHQDYFERNGGQPYCAYVVAPKVAKFRKAFRERLKSREQDRG